MKLTAEFFVHNREKIARMLSEGQALVLYATSAPQSSADARYPYHFDRSLYYFTGITQENTALVIYRRDDRIISRLYIEHRTPTQILWTGSVLSKEEAAIVSGFDKANIFDFADFPNHLISHLQQLQSVLLDFSPYANQHSPIHLLAQDIRQKLPYINIENAYPKLVSLRMIKEEVEIKMIEECIRINNQALKEIQGGLIAGRSEHQVAADFLHYLQVNNVTTSFPTIVACGVNATCLHHHPSQTLIQDNQMVLIDCGVDYLGYASDISRTYCVGQMSEIQKKLYDIVIKMQEAAFATIKPGVRWEDVDQATRVEALKHLRELGLAEKAEDVNRLFPHSLGHSLGLDPHDISPSRKEIVLAAGMVMTVEPGLYLPDLGIGIRIEDDIVVTADGYRNLSKEINK